MVDVKSELSGIGTKVKSWASGPAGRWIASSLVILSFPFVRKWFSSMMHSGPVVKLLGRDKADKVEEVVSTASDSAADVLEIRPDQ